MEWFDNPPVLTGDEKQQLVNLNSYLYRISEQLNRALGSLTVEQFTPEAKQEIVRLSGGDDATRQQVNTLKSLIIKTADIIRSEMDEISTSLRSQYEALSSDYGSYKEQTENDIRANAEGISQQITKTTELESEMTGFGAYKSRYESFIYAGTWTEGNVQVSGIAIGDGVTEYDAQGNPRLVSDRKIATFTSGELAFYINGAKVAYLSNDKLYISNAEILGSLTMGNYYWRILSDGSMGLTMR